MLNVTNQCNLSCAYCYEYSEDKIVDTTNGAQPKFMERRDGAPEHRPAVPRSGRQRGGARQLLWWRDADELPGAEPRRAVCARAGGHARQASRVQPDDERDLADHRDDRLLADHDISVTVSIDGPREMQDRFRVFHDGRGTYDVLLPRVRELLRRHRSRPIGARVTLTSQVNDILGIYHHLTDEIGFQEVGFAPVTTSPGRDYALGEAGFDQMVAEFKALADEFLETAVAGRHHGFSNVSETLEEIHKGVSKAYPCGAGLGLMGVSTGGDVALCHRFAGSDEHKLGSVTEGIDRDAQSTSSSATI